MLALKTAICKWHTSFMFPFTWVKQVILLGLTSTRQGRAILPKFHKRIEILVNKQEIFQTLILQETCILQLIPNNDIHQRLGNIYLPQLNAGLSSQALNKGRFLFWSDNKENEEIAQSTSRVCHYSRYMQGYGRRERNTVCCEAIRWQW